MKLFFAMKKIAHIKVKFRLRQIINKRTKLNDYHTKIDQFFIILTKFYKVNFVRKIKQYLLQQEEYDIFQKQTIANNIYELNKRNLYKSLIEHLIYK